MMPYYPRPRVQWAFWGEAMLQNRCFFLSWRSRIFRPTCFAEWHVDRYDCSRAPDKKKKWWDERMATSQSVFPSLRCLTWNLGSEYKSASRFQACRPVKFPTITNSLHFLVWMKYKCIIGNSKAERLMSELKDFCCRFNAKEPPTKGSYL